MDDSKLSQRENKHKDQARNKQQKGRSILWRKPWWTVRTQANDVHNLQQSDHTETAPDMQACLTKSADLSGQPCKLSSCTRKPSLSFAAAVAYSAGTAVASIAAAALLWKLPPSSENVIFGKSQSAARALSASRSESRLKALEDEAVVAALAAAAATAAAAAERARLAAQAALAGQMEQGYGKGVGETCSALGSDVEDRSLNDTRSQTLRQNEVLPASASKRRRMPKSRPPRPQPPAPRPSAPVQRVSGVTPRVSGQRSAAEDFGLNHLPLGSVMGTAKVVPTPAISPRLAARLADLVSSVVPNKVPSTGIFNQIKAPLGKGGRGSVSRSAKGAPTPTVGSNTTEPAPGPLNRSAPATYQKSTTRYGSLQGQSSASALQPNVTHPQPAVSHAQTSAFHSQPHAPRSIAATLYDTHPQTAAYPQRLSSQPQETSSHQPNAVQFQQRTSTAQSNAQSCHPTERMLSTSSSRPSDRLVSNAFTPSAGTAHPLHALATPTLPNVTAGNNPSLQNTYVSSLDQPYESFAATIPVPQPRPKGTVEMNLANVSSPPVAQAQLAHSPQSQTSSRQPNTYGTLPPRLAAPASGSSPVSQVYIPPLPKGSEPQISLAAMLPSITSHQFALRHPVESPVKAHRSAVGQRPSSATQSPVCGLRGRGLNRTSISAAALDLSRSLQSSVAWAGIKIAAPADDPSSTYPENALSSSEGTDKESFGLYQYQSVPLTQQVAVPWPNTWDGTSARPFTAASAEKEVKQDSEPLIQDSLSIGVDVLLPTSTAALAWDLYRSGSINSLSQSYLPTEAPPTRQPNDGDKLCLNGSLLCEQKSTSILWDKNTPMNAIFPPQTNLEYQTTWLPSLETQAQVQCMQSTPTDFNNKKNSVSYILGDHEQALDSGITAGYQDAFYQQNCLETLEAVCIQQQLESQRSQQQHRQPLQPVQSQHSTQSQQSLHAQHSLQPFLSTPHLQPQLQSQYPLQSQHPIQPQHLSQPQSQQHQQSQQQYFPETVLEEEPQ